MTERITSTPSRFELSHLSVDLYRRFVTNARANDYTCIRFCDLDTPPKGRYIVLRHDIDLSPAYALEMAKLEVELGVRSTYFVLLDGLFYNALAYDNLKHIRAIHELGHEVGLHFSSKGVPAEDLDREIELRMQILSTMIGAPTRSFSQHDPVNTGAVTLGLGKYIDAYEAIKTHDLLYVSDSGMKWRKHTFETAVATGKNLCLLSHPISWMHPGDDLIAIIREVEAREIERITGHYDSFAINHIQYYERRAAEGE